jgi:tetratricopeptide (TPR) repeat protein
MDFGEILRRYRAITGVSLYLCLSSSWNLARVYAAQGRYDEAEPLLTKAYNGRISKLGPEHPHTLESLNNLIELYEAWEKPERAEEWRAKLPQTEALKE